jgi:hypothetical protein
MNTRKIQQIIETPNEEAIELTRLEPIVLEVDRGGELLSHLILFEIKAKLNMNGEGLTVDGDIKETIYQMREF